MSQFVHDKFSFTDEALVEMLRLDHGWALKEIFNKYHAQLFGLAEGVLRDEALAKDIVQEIFIDLWNRRHHSDIRVLSHYLSRAVKFQVLKQIRDSKKYDRHVEVLENIQFVNQTEQDINARELENYLSKAIDQLPPRCKEVFILSRYENLSHKEISSRLNISPKTIEFQITKALTHLRSFIDKTTIFVGVVLFF